MKYPSGPTTYTPGPWRIETKGLSGCFGVIVSKKPCVEIAEIPFPGIDTNAEANAHLIVFAPDLLEACKEVLDIINAYSHIPAQFRACKILQQVIAKAEGKE